MIHKIYKEQGETPLEALERFRMQERLPQDMPLTYAGRLNPMAEGLLLVLSGKDCKDKDKYTGLDKEYEIEIVFGIDTDTYDSLGVIQRVRATNLGSINDIDVSKYVGKFIQEYPAYSSKTVDGEQLHTLARAGKLPDDMPTKSVEIYSIKSLCGMDVSGQGLAHTVLEKIKKVKGDFRQREIADRWRVFSVEHAAARFVVLNIQVLCSSGTYMRSLAHRMGQDVGTGAIALSIKRTKILSKDLAL